MKASILICSMATLMLFSCNNEGNVKSTPIDSTNANGTAPVDYGNEGSNGSTPGNTTLPDENQNSDKVNTPDGDSVPAGRR